MASSTTLRLSARRSYCLRTVSATRSRPAANRWSASCRARQDP
jgi:hypothetical protein